MPRLKDFYDEHDPRGMSSSEHDGYQKAVDEYYKLGYWNK